MSGPEFDRYAETYDAELDNALSPSGESKQYFAQARVNWLAARLRGVGFKATTGLDYGCGVGDTCPILRSALGLQNVTGLDISVRSLQLARERHPDAACRFLSFADYAPSGDVDIAYCNGVFHHIAPGERSAVIDLIRRSLRPRGIFAFWENNAWSPATRYVMSRCSFDQDAITISPTAAKSLLCGNGFEVLRSDFLFFFPSWLKPLRFVEPYLSRIPLGAQYLVLCRKV